MSWADLLGESRPLKLRQGTIRYRERGSGPTLVLVHGLLTNAVVWNKVVPTLAKHARCIALELPFGAHSDPMPEDTDLSLPGMAEIVGDAIEALELDDVTLVGITAGGAVCQI